MTNSLSNWYAVYTRSHHEKKIAAQLCREQVEVFLPLRTTLKQWSDRKKKVEVPLFPGYDFVRIALTQKLRVLEVDGVVKFVAIGSANPTPVPDGQIESLKLVVASPKTIRKEKSPLNHGELVKVKSGPFAGAQGIVVRARNSTRVVISIESIQQAVSVEVAAEQLEPVNQKSEVRVQKSEMSDS